MGANNRGAPLVNTPVSATRRTPFDAIRRIFDLAASLGRPVAVIDQSQGDNVGPHTVQYPERGIDNMLRPAAQWSIWWKRGRT